MLFDLDNNDMEHRVVNYSEVLKENKNQDLVMVAARDSDAENLRHAEQDVERTAKNFIFKSVKRFSPTTCEALPAPSSTVT